MQKVACINCGLRYKVRDDLAGRALKCPNCGVPIRVARGTGGEVSDEQLRAEILRLAGSSAAVRPAAGPASQDRRGEIGAALRGYIAVIVGLCLVAGAAVAGSYLVLS